MLNHRRVPEVEFDQFVVSLPALVPEAVVVIGVAIKVHVEPVLIGAIPFFFLQVPESPEPAAHMVEYPIQHNTKPCVVERLAYLCEIAVGTQAGVQMEVIPGIIAVAVAVKHRIEQNGVCSNGLDMVYPVQQAQNTGGCNPVVLHRGAAQAQRIDLIDDCFVKPHNDVSPFARRAFCLFHHTTFHRFPQ